VHPFTRRAVLVLLGILGLAGHGAGRSDPTEIDSPTEIDRPGEYVLTSDISASEGPCLDITADAVALDGAGHAVDAGRDASAVSVSGDRVTVRNVDAGAGGLSGTGVKIRSVDRFSLVGSSVSGGTGVRAANATRVEIRECDLVGVEPIVVRRGTDLRIADSTVESEDFGVQVSDSTDVVIEDSAVDVFAAGVELDGVTDAVVRDNAIDVMDAGVRLVDSDRVGVTYNHVSAVGPAVDTARSEGVTVRYNTVCDSETVVDGAESPGVAVEDNRTDCAWRALKVVGTGDRTEYEFAVSGELEAADDTEERDGVSEGAAAGWVTEPSHVDTYRFTGEIERFEFRRGFAEVYVRLDPNRL